MVLAISFGLICLVGLAALAAYREARAAYHGLALSNGVEVLVSPETYRAIVDEYLAVCAADQSAGADMASVPDDAMRWDEAVLKVMKQHRPREWRFLVESLNASAGAGAGAPTARPGPSRIARSVAF
jgi:hypothetical protein